MARRPTPADPDAVAGALERIEPDLAVGQLPDSPDGGADVRLLVRHSLALLSRTAPGRSVEVRVPPYAAVQCVPGPAHTRGTPPGVVETDPVTWLLLAAGRLEWAEACRAGRVDASGQRTDLTAYLPLLPTAR